MLSNLILSERSTAATQGYHNDCHFSTCSDIKIAEYLCFVSISARRITGR